MDIMSGGKASQRKGKAFEKSVSERIKEIPGWHAEHRIPQGRGGGLNNPDVRADCEHIRLHIECGHYKSPPVPAKWRQAVRDHGPHADPVAWIRWTRGIEIVIVSWGWMIEHARPEWIWAESAGNARAAIEKATDRAWVGCTPVGAWVCDARPLAVIRAQDFITMMRDIAIDIGSSEGTE